MKRHLVMLIALAAIAPAAVDAAKADSWIFKRSTYSHDPMTGERVAQYSRPEPAYAQVDPTYRQSGYRHIRTNLRGPDGSADRQHIVQTWGAGEMIRPYGEWERPFREGATPYGPWGNPQGPWTQPFDSWSNPYGQWNRYPYSYRYPYPLSGHSGGYYGPMPMPYGGAPGDGHDGGHGGGYGGGGHAGGHGP